MSDDTPPDAPRAFLKLASKACSQCPWLQRLDLRPGRLEDIRETCIERDTHFVCHKSLHRGKENEVICRGYFDQLGHERPSQGMRIAYRMGRIFKVPAIEEVDPNLIARLPRVRSTQRYRRRL